MHIPSLPLSLFLFLFCLFLFLNKCDFRFFSTGDANNSQIITVHFGCTLTRRLLLRTWKKMKVKEKHKGKKETQKVKKQECKLLFATFPSSFLSLSFSLVRSCSVSLFCSIIDNRCCWHLHCYIKLNIFRNKSWNSSRREPSSGVVASLFRIPTLFLFIFLCLSLALFCTILATCVHSDLL